MTVTRWSDLNPGDLVCNVWTNPMLVLQRTPQSHGTNLFLLLDVGGVKQHSTYQGTLPPSAIVWRRPIYRHEVSVSSGSSAEAEV